MKDVLTYAEYLDSQDRRDLERQRAERQEQYAIEKDKREQRRLDMAFEREKRAADLAFRNEELENKAGSVIYQLYSLDANRPDYRDKKKESLTSGDNYGVLNSKYGNQIVTAMKDLDAQHDNMREWYKSRADETGYSVDFYDPSNLTKEGYLDFKGLDERFAESAKGLAARQAQEQMEKEKEIMAQGMVPKITSYDTKTGKIEKEFVPKAETGTKEILQQGKALNQEFQSEFGKIGTDVLNYPIGTKDPRGYTITRGEYVNDKFKENPAGNAVKIHDATHPKNDKVVGIDTFNQYKGAYQNFRKSVEEHRQAFPGLLESESKGEQKPTEAPRAEQGGGAPTSKVEQVEQSRATARQAESARSKTFAKIKSLDKELYDLNAALAQYQDSLSSNASEDVKQESRNMMEMIQAEIADKNDQIAKLQEGVVVSGRKTSPLSGGEGGTTKSGKPPLSDFDQ
jgi:hypothetical protein